MFGAAKNRNEKQRNYGNSRVVGIIGTQNAVAEKIAEREADCLLAVKGNQKTLREEAESTCKRNRPAADYIATKKGHGRIETRRCQVFEKGLGADADNRWKGLQSVVKITAARETGNKISAEERSHISSLDAKQPFDQYIRSCWGVENSLYRTLDTVFREDGQRKCAGHAAENFSVIRKTALNLLKKDTGKENLCSKRLKAAWNKDFLIQ
ncbi:Transposase [Bacteroidales bacterium Barb6XT]|nr:Transposase [Bacteroidales bacterium Barb6XT]